ncbi:hypothetical protein [Thermofilum sp.]|uniref:hypothetical protein n=1 Tax=Thermofilum sp. TaxID=1961369 RepID=UPI0031608A5A
MQRTKNSASLLLKLLETDTVRLEAAEKKIRKNSIDFHQGFWKDFLQELSARYRCKHNIRLLYIKEKYPSPRLFLPFLYKLKRGLREAGTALYTCYFYLI